MGGARSEGWKEENVRGGGQAAMGKEEVVAALGARGGEGGAGAGDARGRGRRGCGEIGRAHV